MSVFEVIPPKEPRVPILLSSPHSGTQFPNEVRDSFEDGWISNPEDTDWFIDQLYGFAPDLGITLIRAELSRYVIDLNRDPESQALYTDGRKETALVPTMSFSGKPLYRSEPPDKDEIQRRKKLYYDPYYAEIRRILDDFDRPALFFDAHSIKREVSSIQSDPFPDLILGNQDGRTADSKLIDRALLTLNGAQYECTNNNPFKGGQLTRYFGDPTNGIHSLQLEMSQDLYMDGLNYSESKASEIQAVLRSLFENLKEVIEELS